jgi:hypothetical protein
MEYCRRLPTLVNSLGERDIPLDLLTSWPPGLRGRSPRSRSWAPRRTTPGTTTRPAASTFSPRWIRRRVLYGGESFMEAKVRTVGSDRGRPVRPRGGRRRSGPAQGGGHAPFAFPDASRFCMARLCGRAGRLNTENAGFRPLVPPPVWSTIHLLLQKVTSSRFTILNGFRPGRAVARALDGARAGGGPPPRAGGLRGLARPHAGAAERAQPPRSPR